MLSEGQNDIKVFKNSIINGRIIVCGCASVEGEGVCVHARMCEGVCGVN